jgi:GNAT superfamily N-acetyltransferase
MLNDGYTDLPPGKIASVVTYLEMQAKPELAAPMHPPGISLRRVTKPDLNWYRNLFRLVGTEWLWFARLAMNDDELHKSLWASQTEVFALSENAENKNEDKGLLELNRTEPNEIEIAYFGISSDLIGKGAGRFLLHRALEVAWSHNPTRVWLHTCNLDHPRATSFYQAAGFKPYKFAIEVTDDPRLTGLLPMDAAPQVPILRPPHP